MSRFFFPNQLNLFVSPCVIVLFACDCHLRAMSSYKTEASTRERQHGANQQTVVGINGRGKKRCIFISNRSMSKSSRINCKNSLNPRSNLGPILRRL